MHCLHSLSSLSPWPLAACPGVEYGQYGSRITPPFGKRLILLCPVLKLSYDASLQNAFDAAGIKCFLAPCSQVHSTCHGQNPVSFKTETKSGPRAEYIKIMVVKLETESYCTYIHMCTMRTAGHNTKWASTAVGEVLKRLCPSIRLVVCLLGSWISTKTGTGLASGTVHKC